MQPITEFFRKLLVFFAGFFQGDRPESFARGITLVIVMFVLAWDSYYVRCTKQLVDVATMAGQVLFMTAFYCAGKGLATYADVKKQAAADPPAQP